MAYDDATMAKALFDTSSTAAANLIDQAGAAPGGILSKPLIDTGSLKQVLFVMDEGQQISEHKAPYVATVHMLRGRLTFRAAGQTHTMAEHDWIVMPPNTPHDLIADQPAVFLLTLVKG